MREPMLSAVLIEDFLFTRPATGTISAPGLATNPP
jgi:hypothetical protein